KTSRYFGKLEYQMSNDLSTKGIKYYNFDITSPFDPDPETSRLHAAIMKKTSGSNRSVRDLNEYIEILNAALADQIDELPARSVIDQTLHDIEQLLLESNLDIQLFD